MCLIMPRLYTCVCLYVWESVFLPLSFYILYNSNLMWYTKNCYYFEYVIVLFLYCLILITAGAGSCCYFILSIVFDRILVVVSFDGIAWISIFFIEFRIWLRRSEIDKNSNNSSSNSKNSSKLSVWYIQYVCEFYYIPCVQQSK